MVRAIAQGERSVNVVNCSGYGWRAVRQLDVCFFDGRGAGLDPLLPFAVLRIGQSSQPGFTALGSRKLTLVITKTRP